LTEETLNFNKFVIDGAIQNITVEMNQSDEDY